MTNAAGFYAFHVVISLSAIKDLSVCVCVCVCVFRGDYDMLWRYTVAPTITAPPTPLSFQGRDYTEEKGKGKEAWSLHTLQSSPSSLLIPPSSSSSPRSSFHSVSPPLSFATAGVERLHLCSFEKVRARHSIQGWLSGPWACCVNYVDGTGAQGWGWVAPLAA